jgi:hypothetical protein
MTEVTAPTANGKSTDDAPLPPPRSNVSLRPALFVLGLAVVIVFVFSLASALTSDTTPKAGSPPPKIAADVPGVPLRAQGAEKGLAPILTPDQPPSNIVDAVALPVGWTRVSTQNNAADAYDSQVRFTVPGAQSELIDFYATELPRLGWKVVSKGPTVLLGKSVYEVLGTKAGDDGNYWEIGAVISPTTFTGTGSSDITAFTVRLFQVSDDS